MKKRLAILGCILFLLSGLLVFNLVAENQPAAAANAVPPQVEQNDQSGAMASTLQTESIFSLDKLMAFAGFGLVIILAFFSWSRTAPHRNQQEK